WEASPTCTNYCHGGKWSADANYRGNTTSPSWTATTADADCGDCHRSPPATSGHSTVTGTTECGSCHNGYVCTAANLAACTVNKTVHMNGSLQVNASCTGCHATQVTGSAAGFSITRRPITPEFGYAWSHKRSANPIGTVSAADCGVCHMEGDVSGNMNGTYHGNGRINLRDPDTGLHIKQVAFVTVGNSVTAGNSAGWGYYDTSSAADASFYTFARNLSNATLEGTVQAIMINQCLKCHDSNGATNASARIGADPTKPFGTTIGSTTNYTGADVTAGGTPGGVTDVNYSFATSNASYHPIRGRQNNSYVTATRMYAPWNGITKTAGNTTSWGYIISCWDCHAPQGATGLQTMTVTAHGGTTTLRQAYWSANATNLCTACHRTVPATGASTNNHGAGSAWASGGNGTPGQAARDACYRCHGSYTNSKPPRPYAGQDAHGFNAFAPYAGTGDTMWPVGSTAAQEKYRPYAFMRNAGSVGTWNTAGDTVGWRPASAPGIPAGTATCRRGSASGCSNGHGDYTPGGVY
ncbi:MAG: CxxxxCH/CxxCH domain-containing protein, partial [Rhodocyclales bacterium GT-UBC]